MDNEIITSEKLNVLLWLFSVEIRDRRNGQELSGQAIEIGEKNYDIEAAIEKIERKYSVLGYELLAAELKEQKTYKMDVQQIYKELPPDERDDREENVADITQLIGRQYVKEDYGSWQSCNEAAEAALRELEGAE